LKAKRSSDIRALRFLGAEERTARRSRAGGLSGRKSLAAARPPTLKIHLGAGSLYNALKKEKGQKKK